MVKLTNQNRTIEVNPETGAFRTDKLQPGEFGHATGEGANRWAYAIGGRHSVSRFEVGSLVIIPLDPADYYTSWECFAVAENPDYQQPEAAQPVVREVSHDEFNVRRHGEV